MSDYDGMYFDPGTVELDGKQRTLKELTLINRKDINGELERLPSTMFHIGQIEIGLDLKINEANTSLDVLKSRKYMELRNRKVNEKLTEETIKSMLKDDSELLAMNDSIEALKAYRRSLSNLMSSLHDKRESLRHMAARELEEFRNQELTVRERR